jgi:adenylylsulfate kinase-like enzyme
VIILIFGQPASGKTTLARTINGYITEKIKLGISNDFVCGMNIIIDGDEWRKITQNKDYSKEGRMNNLKGAFDTALFLENAGFMVTISMVAPYQSMRDYLKERAEELVQVHLTYNSKDNRGRNDYFVQDFEKPNDEDVLELNTSALSVYQCVNKLILKTLKS